jgi:hypothetical protein
MKLSIHLEGTKQEITNELLALAADFEGAPVSKKKVKVAKIEPTEAEEFEMPSETETEVEPEVEPEAEEPAEPETISDEDMRERGAKFIKKNPANGAKLKKMLAERKIPNLVAVHPKKREAFLKALGA